MPHISPQTAHPMVVKGQTTLPPPVGPARPTEPSLPVDNEPDEDEVGPADESEVTSTAVVAPSTTATTSPATPADQDIWRGLGSTW